jgi:DNA-binding CsgD family transcriptional regulator
MEGLSRFEAAQAILPRDLEVIRLMVAGNDRPVIAEMLDVSVSTVGRHIAKVKRLTDSVTHSQMIQELTRRGHLDGPETPGKRAAAIARSHLMPDPDGVVDEHTNAVIEGLALQLERELS